MYLSVQEVDSVLPLCTKIHHQHYICLPFCLQGCGKFRINDQDFGNLPGTSLPRLLDMVCAQPVVRLNLG